MDEAKKARIMAAMKAAPAPEPEVTEPVAKGRGQLLHLTPEELMHLIYRTMGCDRATMIGTLHKLGISRDRYVDRMRPLLYARGRAAFEAEFLTPYRLRFDVNKRVCLR